MQFPIYHQNKSRDKSHTSNPNHQSKVAGRASPRVRATLFICASRKSIRTAHQFGGVQP